VKGHDAIETTSTREWGFKEREKSMNDKTNIEILYDTYAASARAVIDLEIEKAKLHIQLEIVASRLSQAGEKRNSDYAVYKKEMMKP
jgi:hypothetical protein